VPNLVVWATSWLLGPGFALGTGSVVSPLGTQLGLVPALPLLGALQGTPDPGYAVIVVPVVIAFAAGVVLRPRLAAGGRAPGIAALVLAGLGMGVVAASILALLAIWSGGAAGPGRLADIGPDPSAVWVWSAIEIGPSAALGLIVGLSRRLLDRSTDDPEWAPGGSETPAAAAVSPDAHKL
jgi:hypothetical protein